MLPGNALLPPHQGMIITRGLQELACLLPQDLSFDTVTRLLSWQTQDDQVLSDTTVRNLVRSHGQIIRQAEQAEVEALLSRDDLATLTPLVVPLPHSRAAQALNRLMVRTAIGLLRRRLGMREFQLVGGCAREFLTAR